MPPTELLVKKENTQRPGKWTDARVKCYFITWLPQVREWSGEKTLQGRGVFFTGHIPQVTSTGHHIFNS